MQHCASGVRALAAALAGWLFGLCLAPAAAATQGAGTGAVADAAQDGRFTIIKAGKVITVSGEEIERGMVVISEGKIENVGRRLEYPRNARVIDASDMTVMPGLVLAHTRAGFPNYTRTGVHGDWTVADEFYPTAGQFDDLLDHGFTAAAIIPPGRGIPGRALVVRTGGNDEQRELVSPGYLRIAADKKELRDALKKAQAEIDKVEKARREHEAKLKGEASKKSEGEGEPAPKPQSTPSTPAPEADQVDEGSDGQPRPPPRPASQPASRPTSQPAFEPPKIDPAYQPLVDLIQKKEGVRALIEIDGASDYLHIAEVLAKYEGLAHDWKLANPVQSDFYHVLDRFAESKPRVIFWVEQNRVPYSAERLPLIRMAWQAGCEVSLIPRADRRQWQASFLQQVAELVRNGWPREAALAALTANPARLLGIEARVGTIEAGKEADLVFLDGDPFEPGTRVRKVMIAGQIVHEVEGVRP